MICLYNAYCLLNHHTRCISKGIILQALLGSATIDCQDTNYTCLVVVQKRAKLKIPSQQQSLQNSLVQTRRFHVQYKKFSPPGIVMDDEGYLLISPMTEIEIQPVFVVPEDIHYFIFVFIFNFEQAYETYTYKTNAPRYDSFQLVKRKIITKKRKTHISTNELMMCWCSGVGLTRCTQTHQISRH